MRRVGNGHNCTPDSGSHVVLQGLAESSGLMHRDRRHAERMTCIRADGAGGAPGAAAPAGPRQKERPQCWRTRRGRSYTLHTTEALVEVQTRRSGDASEDWGRHCVTSGGPGPIDIVQPSDPLH